MRPFDPTDATALLARTPRVLDAWLTDLPAAWIDATEGPDTWSPRQVVEHLLHAEEWNWIPRARLLLARPAEGPLPTFAPLAPEAPAHADPLGARIARFARRRGESLATLAGWPLDADALQREGEHPELGRVELRQLLATWVAHDQAHLAQIARVLAKQYREAVGPWRRYLRVMEW